MVRRSGFTLVELVVVIMILGVLAAVAAPKFFRTSSSATDNGLKQTLSIIRDAIQLHVAEHPGEYPGADGLEATFKADVGEYLRSGFPECPVGPLKNATVSISTDSVALVPEANPAVASWAYSNKTGEFICNWDEPLASDTSSNYGGL